MFWWIFFYCFLAPRRQSLVKIHQLGYQLTGIWDPWPIGRVCYPREIDSPRYQILGRFPKVWITWLYINKHFKYLHPRRFWFMEKKLDYPFKLKSRLLWFVHIHKNWILKNKSQSSLWENSNKDWRLKVLSPGKRRSRMNWNTAGVNIAIPGPMQTEGSSRGHPAGRERQRERDRERTCVRSWCRVL